MSAIAGIIHFDGAPVEPGFIEKMTAAMAHRGPDGVSHWVRGSVALGQCMLCTTPESLEEKQPLANEDESLVLVMDGRVDNWEELRRELLGKSARLRDRSDAELVLRSYETWGGDCLAHIDGDFALVIWDARRRTAFCARDRMGHKPFNYCWDGRALRFASEVRAILAVQATGKGLNEGMLAECLSGDWCSRTETFWNGVLRLPAAGCLRAGEHGLHASQYWRPDLWSRLPCKSDRDCVEYYKMILQMAVRHAARSHRPAAFEVSGGLDSSAVFCVAHDLERAGSIVAPGLRGYSFAAGGDGVLDEAVHSRAVGTHLGRPIDEVPHSAMPLRWYAEQARFYQEFPGFVNGTLTVGLRTRARDDGATVVVTGEGGDQWLSGGHTYYAELLALRHWGPLLRRFRDDLSDAGPRAALSWLLRGGILPSLPARLREELRMQWRKARRAESPASPHLWLSPAMTRLWHERSSGQRKASCETVAREGQRALLADLDDAFFAQALERSERTASGLGVEIRHPLRSRAIVEFAFAVPEHMRRRGSVNKFLHRLALRGVVPKAVLERTTKAGSDGVFRRQLLPLADDFLQRIPAARSAWVSPSGLRNLFEGYRSGALKGAPQWALWAVAGCDAWLP